MWQMAKVREIAVKKILDTPALAHEQLFLLELSTKLEIMAIRDKAIQVLSGTLRPVKRIQLGVQFKVDSWLLDGCIELVQAPGGISVEDENILGWEMTSKLFRIREEYLKMRIQPSYSRHSPNPCTFVTDKIIEVFAEELRDAVWSARG